MSVTFVRFGAEVPAILEARATWLKSQKAGDVKITYRHQELPSVGFLECFFDHLGDQREIRFIEVVDNRNWDQSALLYLLHRCRRKSIMVIEWIQWHDGVWRPKNLDVEVKIVGIWVD